MTAISCPVCEAPFQESVREGILIDICTQCRGIWLDRGELEKLLATMRSEAGVVSMQTAPATVAPATQAYAPPPQTYKSHYPPHQNYSPSRYYDDGDDDYHRPSRYHRKKSKLQTLLDILD